MAWIGNLHSWPIIGIILEFCIKNKITEGIWKLSTVPPLTELESNYPIFGQSIWILILNIFEEDLKAISLLAVLGNIVCSILLITQKGSKFRTQLEQS